MKILVAASIAIAAFSLSARADGIPETYRGAAYVAPFSWTGLYIGLHAGWERKDIEGSDPVRGLFTSELRLPEPDSQDIDGWIGGLQFGYNHQFDRVVVGIELSGSWGNVNGNGNCFAPLEPFDADLSISQKQDCHAEQRWTVQWLNKLGYAFGREGRLLAYVTGGVAATELSIDRTVSATLTELDCDPIDCFSTTLDGNWSGGRTTFVGVVLGGGLQYAITSNISLGAEYLHGEYADADIALNGSVTSTNCSGGECESESFKFNTNAHDQFRTDTVRAVLNFKFGDRPEPVAVLK